MDKLPKEMIFKIAFMMENWDDIWSFSMVYKFLRKDMGFARFARTIFNKATCCTHTFSVKWCDDRCRHWDIFIHTNPDFQDCVDLTEHWLVNHPWIDYNCDPSTNEFSPNQWIYFPYGRSYNNVDGVTSSEIIVTWVTGSEFESVTNLSTQRENFIKEIHNNNYIKLIHEHNKMLCENSPEHQTSQFGTEYIHDVMLIDYYSDNSDFET